MSDLPDGPTPPPARPAPPPQGYSQPPSNQQAPRPQNDGLQTIIPTQNPPALVSYYCGIFSLTLCPSPIIGPIAILQGMKALNNIKGNPGLKGKSHAISGIIMGSIGLAITL